MTFYSRKSPRIPDFDYSSENYYFITICTQNRKCIFGTPDQLNRMGQIAKQHIENIESHYDDVYVDKHVVMPNHIHMILVLQCSGKYSADQIVAQYKSGVTRDARKEFSDIWIWQRSFHDHVIRNQKDYDRIWSYIDTNPMRWDKDCFYVEE